MKKVLIYTANPINNITSVLHNNMCDVMQLLVKKAEVTLMCNTKRVLKYYQQRMQNDAVKYVLAKPLVKTDEEYMYKHSMEYLDQLDKKYDVFLTYGLLSNTSKGMLKTLKSLSDGNGQLRITFSSVIMHCNPVIVVDDILKKYKNIHICCNIIDYKENDISEVWPDADIEVMSWYDDASNGYKKLSINEYCNFKDGFKDTKKTQDFVFGYALTWKDRKYLSDFVRANVVEDSMHKLFVKDAYWNGEKRDNTIPHDEYKAELAKTRYTLLAPSTVASEFSIGRFNEAIIRKCLPIFMPEVKYERGFEHDKEMCKFIKDNLTFSDKYKSIADFISKHDYDKLVKELYSLSFMKKHIDGKKYAADLVKQIGL